MEESRDRDILLRLAKQHQDNYHWNRFIEARNAFKTHIRQAKNNYILNQLETNRNDSKVMHSGIA